MSSKKLAHDELLEAKAERHIVRIDRKPKFADRLYGFVIQVGKQWVLLAQTSDGGYSNGYVAFRIGDIKKIKRDRTFQTKYAQAQPEWPPKFSRALGLESTTDVLVGLGASGVLMGIQKENQRHAMWIGTFDEILGKFFYLHEVRPDATWHPAPLGYKLKAITTVEIETHYLVALATIAGAGPSKIDE
jgi:hypothetical protein